MSQFSVNETCYGCKFHVVNSGNFENCTAIISPQSFSPNVKLRWITIDISQWKKYLRN